MLFGSPAELAARHMLTRKLHAQLAGWLRYAEAILRRLIIIEAGAYPRPNTRPLLHPPRKRLRKLMHFTADAPETWRVSFRCFESPRRARPKGAKAEAQSKIRAVVIHDEPPTPRPSRRSRPRSERVRYPPMLRQDRPWVLAKPPPPAFRSAWPLAERFEALLRAFHDPAPHAKRAAARLHATPHRVADALRAPPDAHERIDRFHEFCECAARSWRLHFSSA